MHVNTKELAYVLKIKSEIIIGNRDEDSLVFAAEYNKILLFLFRITV